MGTVLVVYMQDDTGRSSTAIRRGQALLQAAADEATTAATALLATEEPGEAPESRYEVEARPFEDAEPQGEADAGAAQPPVQEPAPAQAAAAAQNPEAYEIFSSEDSDDEDMDTGSSSTPP
eukprot:15437660-Alexandrium_andersonii.AAC.1